MNKKPAILFDIDYTLFDTDFFKESKLLKHKIYDEVIGVLESLAEATTLGIFSKGETEFQKTKLLQHLEFFQKEKLNSKKQN